MRIALVGADFEENLGVGMLAAAAEAAGHEALVVPFNESAAIGEVAARIVAARPDAVGLSIQFQHRALEFLALATRLRALGFAGHLTCGGHFPTLAWREVLGGGFGLDSVVLHDGERTLVALLEALATGRPQGEVPGLALRIVDGAPTKTAPCPLDDALDDLPFPRRYRPHARHLGVPFIPIVGSRGCWGACSYCSITSFYRDARATGGGRTLRLRSPESVAAEMALLWHDAGGPSIFCFHDDNLLLPRPSDTLARLRAIRAALDEYGVGRVAIVGKCRPDCLTPELAGALAALGVIRLYVGVENACPDGAAHLRRRTQAEHVEAALAACRAAGIFVCYNLLVFEPDATLDHLRANVAFIRAHASHPVNFCRAEPYYGTPMHRDLAARGALGGSWLGFNYRVADDRAEVAFRVASAAFRQRNFDPDGVGNRSMGVGYALKVLAHFHPERDGRGLVERGEALTRAISLETADLLEEAIDLAARCDPADHDPIERATALLGLRVAAADAVRHAALDALYDDLDRLAQAAPAPRARSMPPRRLRELARKLALGASLATSAAGVAACDHTAVVDPVPPDGFVVDPVPVDMARDLPVVDPAPMDQSVPTWMDLDPVPADLGRPFDMSLIVDPVPPDLAPPPDGDTDGPRDAAPQQSLLAPTERRPGGYAPPSLPPSLIDQWRNTSPELAVRSPDLPLHAPPSVRLAIEPVGDSFEVRLVGGPLAVSTRWEGDQILAAEGRTARWRPVAPTDQIRVGVRTRGGVAVLALRARGAGGRG